MSRSASLLCLFSLIPALAFAQMHPTVQRPKGDWMELKTPHFRIIFPAGHESTAIESGKILESQVTSTTSFFGSSIKNLPVVVDPYSHSGNGYVTIFPFRMEFNTAPVKGNIINPRSATWLEAMLPHEMVHAAHINTIPENSIPKFLSFFSPDMGRFMHFTTPLGIIEGLAVHHESNLVPGYSGRLNYPYFTLQNNGWGVWQSISPAGATYPSDRHYIGGSMFTEYLLETYGEEKVRNLVRSQASWPFFGFGFQMRRTLGKWSWDIEKDYRAVMDDQEEYSRDGVQVSRPQFLDNDRILSYQTGYRKRPGFYVTDVSSGATSLVHEAQLTEDGFFSLSDDRKTVVFSRYVPHPRYEGQNMLKTHTLDVATWTRADLVEGLHTVVMTPDTLIGFRPVDQEKQKVIPNPAFPNIRAVIMRDGGMQGLWLIYPRQEDLILSLPPDISFPMASVLDANWSADGLRLMITSDYDRTLQVYEYDYENDRMFRVSNEPKGALEGAISPDGRRYAYVSVRGDRKTLSIAERRDAGKTELERQVWTRGYLEHPRQEKMGAQIRTEGWSSAPYRSADWLAPRLWFPLFGPVSNGVILSSGDILRRHSYDAYLGFGERQAFYDFRYTTTTTPLPVTLRSAKIATTTGTGKNITYSGFETSNRISVNFTRYPDADARYSQFTASPFIGYRTVRHEAGTLAGLEIDSWFIGADLILAHRLRQFLRDPQPSAGILLYGDVDMDLSYERRFVTPLVMVDPARAFRGLAFVYTPIGLRLDSELFLQNRRYHVFNSHLATNFNTQQVVNPDSEMAASLGARYAFPMFHPDTKWPLMPFYSERFYGVVFGKTVLDDALTNRSLIGVGLRFKSRIGNFGLDIGAGVAWEPANGDVLFTSNF